MRVGIIGGGAAGLASAWLLEHEHDVTLFEKDDRFGGHAHTVTVEADGQSLDVDAGFEFFAPGAAYATFNRLLDILEVPRRSYPATLTVYDTARQRPVVMPPLRGGLPVWSSFTPRALGTLIRFRRFLADVPAFLALHDRTLTIGEYLEWQRLPREFVDSFLLPLLLAFWCVEPSDFQRFTAYNALYYLGANMPTGLRAPDQSAIEGGLKVYVDALVESLERATLRRDSAVHTLTRDAEGWIASDADGHRHTFDQVVIATNARQALRLLESSTGADELCAQLRRLRYFDTAIAIHGDRRLMPRSEAAWSVVNARWDGCHSSLSIWNPERGLPVFKSWITFDQDLPEPLYAVARYEHGMVDADYFDAQRRLKALHGANGLWLAGLYMDDADSHESAIRSAVNVAQRLAPASARLGLVSAAE